MRAGWGQVWLVAALANSSRRALQPPPPCTGDCQLTPEPAPQPGQLTLGELAGWAQLPAARVPVARRALATYDLVGGLA